MEQSIFDLNIDLNREIVLNDYKSATKKTRNHILMVM